MRGFIRFSRKSSDRRSTAVKIQEKNSQALYLTCEKYYIFELLIFAGGMMGAYTYSFGITSAKAEVSGQSPQIHGF